MIKDDESCTVEAFARLYMTVNRRAKLHVWQFVIWALTIWLIIKIFIGHAYYVAEDITFGLLALFMAILVAALRWTYPLRGRMRRTIVSAPIAPEIIDEVVRKSFLKISVRPLIAYLGCAALICTLKGYPSYVYAFLTQGLLPAFFWILLLAATIMNYGLLFSLTETPMAAARKAVLCTLATIVSFVFAGVIFCLLASAFGLALDGYPSERLSLTGKLFVHLGATLTAAAFYFETRKKIMAALTKFVKPFD